MRPRLLTRRYAVDVQPTGAYWRDLLPAEEKINFAAVEEAEGSTVQGARLRLGLLLHAQREAVLRYCASPRFTPAASRRVPRFFGVQLGNEFVRIRMRGYWDGLTQTNDLLDKPVPDVSQRATDRLVAVSVSKGQSFADRVLEPVRTIVAGAFASSGRRIKTPEMLRGEIRTAYSRWLAPTADATRKELLLASPLAVTRMGWQAWQQRNSPVSGFLEVLFDGLFKDGEVPTLTIPATQDVVVTEYNRQANAAIYEATLKAPSVVSLQYSAIRDARTCPTCLSLDGTVRPKDDYEFWGFYTPPMHSRCRCRVIPVKSREASRVPETSPDDLLKRLDKIGGRVPAGFGGYDPNA